MKLSKHFFTVTFLSFFLMAGQAFAAEEGAVDPAQKSTEKGTMTRPMDNTESHMGTQSAVHDFHRASDFMDASVKGSDGEDLGSVKDIIISSDGQARYIVLSKGGFLGIGGDLIPVPFDVAQPSKGTDGDLTLNIDEQSLDQAPTVAENDLQDSTRWEQDVRGYFGDNGMQRDTQQSTDTYSDDVESGAQRDSEIQVEREQPSTGETGEYNKQ